MGVSTRAGSYPYMSTTVRFTGKLPFPVITMSIRSNHQYYLMTVASPILNRPSAVVATPHIVCCSRFNPTSTLTFPLLVILKGPKSQSDAYSDSPHIPLYYPFFLRAYHDLTRLCHDILWCTPHCGFNAGLPASGL